MLTVVFLWLISVLAPGLTDPACRGHDCLQNYVERPEPSYRWEDLGLRLEGEDWTGYVLNFTSQQWLSPHLVSSSSSSPTTSLSGRLACSGSQGAAMIRLER